MPPVHHLECFGAFLRPLASWEIPGPSWCCGVGVATRGVPAVHGAGLSARDPRWQRWEGTTRAKYL